MQANRFDGAQTWSMSGVTRWKRVVAVTVFVSDSAITAVCHEFNT